MSTPPLTTSICMITRCASWGHRYVPKSGRQRPMTGGSDPEDSVLIMLDRDIELLAPLDHQSARAPRSPTEQACAAPLILAQAVLGAPWLPSAIYSPRPPSWQGTCGIRGHQGGAGLPDRTKLG